MSLSDRELFNRNLRVDLSFFVGRSFQTVAPGHVYAWSWHIDLIAWQLMECLRGNTKRLIISLPPRNLKSIIASVAFPAFALGHDPSCRIICASYAHDLGTKHARDCRAIMASDWYRQLFRRTRFNPAKNTELEFETTARGCRLSTSIGGTLTGRGGNLIIIDDPLKAQDALSEAKRTEVNQWFDNTLYTRLDDKANDCIIVVMQRLHPDDLVGHLLERDGAWKHLSLPAIAEVDEHFVIYDGRIVGRKAGEALHPQRESLETLAGIRRDIGNYDFSAQYQQAPIPPEGNLVKVAWFRRYGEAPEKESGDLVVQSWDTASKASQLNDYSVCTTWLRKGTDHYLLNVTRVRLEYPALKKQIIEMAERYDPDAVLIEDKGSGTSLIQDLRSEGSLRPIDVTPTEDKITRMYAQSAQIEAGHVLLPEKASWLDDFEKEVMLFPKGQHDDQIDSVSQYLEWQKSRTNIDAPIIIHRSQFAIDWEANFGLYRDGYHLTGAAPGLG